MHIQSKLGINSQDTLTNT